VSRTYLSVALTAALTHYPRDSRVNLRWVEDGAEVGITDTVGSIGLLVHAATLTAIGKAPTIVGLGATPLPVFAGAQASIDYLLRRAVDPGPGGHACRQALRYIATRDTTQERISATPVGETVALF
jgi:hypothetical protein